MDYTFADKLQLWTSVNGLIRSIGQENTLKWLNSPSEYLEHKSPYEAIDEGDARKVCEAIEALRQGYFL
ncbi:antitoxin Xre/MbcA/ParS toxin-binding domain-containing protein [Streptomyces sp. S.PB5]|uniref:antitoxin Xre/MbcA/ParS toxin-binding domain-containing protein n=1 Tax=Streptomyces sp. S.PB5 TaxID=3020844 RepID=UPI00339D9EBE